MYYFVLSVLQHKAQTDFYSKNPTRHTSRLANAAPLLIFFLILHKEKYKNLDFFTHLMVKIKVIYDKSTCIGAAACAAMDPKYFEIDSDGKAILKGAKEVEGKFVLEIDDNDDTYQAAESCPVRAIKLINLETGEEII